MTTLTTRTDSPETTRAIGHALGAILPPGAFVALSGALGAGKTCFAQGLARGLGVPEGEPIVSPTFVLAREYYGRLRLVHIDAYRLCDLDELYMLGVDEALNDGASVVAMEWPDRFEALVPANAIRVTLSHDGNDIRKIRLQIDAALADALCRATVDRVHWRSPSETPTTD
ncbi:MAG: tRNA (adenosine(37)-N6)-threonylcarbamoyltransferase complex ATPase subunit type 1 TsaE [Phycisphaerales bacterium]|nr:tRNA (adenosine(37)-N6)-threonylcarbamoyltransferase complex ATPase subunit type 1 TsaE [Phycisphaerales bacterium]